MEEHGTDRLYSIGAISKMVNVSTDTLRYYDDINLLNPALTSKQTGYRYYTDSQITAILQILELKEYGFSLIKISEILRNGKQSQADIYKKRYIELLYEKQKLQVTIDKLEQKIQIKKEGINMEKSILLVDDANFMRMMCKDILEKEGYKIIGEACNGNEALEKYKSLSPDIVLLDIVMPETNGIEALRGIIELNKDVKVVMCSAMSTASMVLESLLAGAQNFITKPFQAKKLASAVSNALNVTQVFNHDALKKIFKLCADNTQILTQEEVDAIISSTLSDNASSSKSEEIINKIISNSKSENDIINDVINDVNNGKINTTLDKIIQGQEDIKKLLTQLIDKTNNTQSKH